MRERTRAGDAGGRSGSTRAKRVVFLDRDGTMLRDRPGFYLRRAEQMRLYPFTARALTLLRRAGYRIVVLTNQSGIGLGYLDRAALVRIHRRLKRELAERGAGIDAIYYCPHAPDSGCACRKPKTTLARRAVREMGLSLEEAAVIGDKRADVDLGRSLGIDSVLVRTGHGRDQRARHGKALRPTHEARNLLAAVRWLLRRRAR